MKSILSTTLFLIIISSCLAQNNWEDMVNSTPENSKFGNWYETNEYDDFGDIEGFYYSYMLLKNIEKNGVYHGTYYMVIADYRDRNRLVIKFFNSKGGARERVFSGKVSVKLKREDGTVIDYGTVTNSAIFGGLFIGSNKELTNFIRYKKERVKLHLEDSLGVEVMCIIHTGSRL